MLAYPGVPSRWRTLDLDVSTAPFLPIEFRKGDLDAPLLHDADEPRDAARHHAAGAAHRIVLSGRRGDRAGDAAVECAMPRINEPYLNLRSSYLFAEIRRRTKAFADAHPDARLIRLGIGDVTRPLPPAVVGAMHEAVDEMARAETLPGLRPLRRLRVPARGDRRPRLRARAASRSPPDEIFVSDGGKSDSANIQEIFAARLRGGADGPGLSRLRRQQRDGRPLGQRRRRRALRRHRLSALHRGERLPARAARSARRPRSISAIPTIPPARWRRGEALARWVDYARGHDAVILYDAAYEAYIRDPDVPHSIYEIEGAREVAIECRSFSKSAGFTGLRCAYTVVPKEMRGRSRRRARR